MPVPATSGQLKTSIHDMEIGIIRSLTGGVAYADENGNKSLEYVLPHQGGWPANNEWDRYIVNFPQELIQEGKTLDDVFHWNGVGTWCQDTGINNGKYTSGQVIPSGDTRVTRSTAGLKSLGFSQSINAPSDRGFRPVFEYKEVK